MTSHHIARHHVTSEGKGDPDRSTLALPVLNANRYRKVVELHVHPIVIVDQLLEQCHVTLHVTPEANNEQSQGNQNGHVDEFERNNESTCNSTIHAFHTPLFVSSISHI